MRKSLFPLCLFFISIAILFLPACSINRRPSNVVADNMVVTLEYKGSLPDGTVFDSSETSGVLKFLTGQSMIIPKLEESIIGMKVGEKKKIDIKAEDAYGPYLEEAVLEVPKNQFPEGVELKEGMDYSANTTQGLVMLRIKKVNEATVTVDFNHPLAGKDLAFDVRIVEVHKPTPEELDKMSAPASGNSSID
ncbi:MAG: peptidylprolyl isomerase [Spirochaetota bacterium]